MKVVALVSGGKDSCYAMMKCIQYGHEVFNFRLFAYYVFDESVTCCYCALILIIFQIVALANLIPADDAIDELDSYMYQTVSFFFFFPL